MRLGVDEQRANVNEIKLGLVGPLPPPYGGMANQLKQLERLLVEDGLKVDVVQNNKPYPGQWVEKLKGVRAVFRLVPYFFDIWKLAGRVEIIHVFSNSGWSWQLFSAPVLWLGWLRKTPVIINYRGGEARSYFEKSIRYIRPSMSLASLVVVPSGYLEAVFKDFGFDNVTVVPNIIDLSRFIPKQHKQKYHLIITRNLEAIYGIDTAIKAVKIIAESYPDIRLTIAGSGYQKEYLQNMVKSMGLEEYIDFAGRLKPDEVVKLYQQADIMLNPTTVDNMPNSVLEAMACGVPVISTDVGGIPFIVENYKTAILVKPGDYKMMAEKVIELFEDKNLSQKLIKNGLEEVCQYSWKNIREQWINLYKDLKKEK